MRRATVIGLVVLLLLAAAGCGSSNKRTLPTAKAESMLRQLDNIASQYDSGACSGAQAKVLALEAQARSLPSSVDPTVRRNLIAGLARLDRLVQRDCKRPPPQTNTNTTPTNTVPTNTTPTTPNTTPTTPGGGGVTVPGTTGAAGAQFRAGGNNGGEGGD